MIKKAKKASTIIITKECKDEYGDFKILMLLRHPGNKFMPLKYVFPGGSMDAQDKIKDFCTICHGLTKEKAMRIINDEDLKENSIASWITGIRETFEETGLLYAYDSNKNLISLEKSDIKHKFNQYRKLIYQKKITFEDFLKKENLILSTDRIFYHSHWITPKMFPIRYDTRFFIAKAPKMQQVIHDEKESSGYVWISPVEAIEKNKRNEFNLAYPTIMTLKTISEYNTIDELLKVANKGQFSRY